MRTTTKFGLALLAAVAGTVPAAAVVKVVTFTGVLEGGKDSTGVLGTAGADLTGLSYIATFTYDTAGRWRFASATEDRIVGGVVYNNGVGYPDPFIDSSITISGKTRQIKTEFSAYYSTSTDYASLVSEGGLYTDDDGNYNSPYGHYRYADYVSLEALVGPFPASLDSNEPVHATSLRGRFELKDPLVDSNDPIVYGYLTSSGPGTTFSVGDPAADTVPEPASWAMFIAGFGLIGGVLRTRRPAVATA